MSEVFAHAPAEYEIKPWKLTWEPPCWIHADIILSPQTADTREKFLLNLNMPHKIDAYAREPWADQLWAAFAPRLSQIVGPHSAKWWDEMMSCHGKLEKQLGETERLFPQPFRFARRKEFVTVDLAAILKASPEALNIYLGLEKGKYGNSFFLRIHSGPPHLGSPAKCLWFEKRMPDFLHEEDVLPWFLATIQRLPKKHRPADVQPWLNRLLHFEPQLTPPSSGVEKPWVEKPKVIFVFGPVGKVGYRGLTHFERRDISRIVRQNEIVKIEGKTRHSMIGNKTMEFERTFHLLAFDEAAAERVERQIFWGERVHFGLGPDIFGMVLRSGHLLHAVNVPIETIRLHCVEPGHDIQLVSNPRDKCRIYEFVKAQNPVIPKNNAGSDDV
jgi:hypothetical protein